MNNIATKIVGMNPGKLKTSEVFYNRQLIDPASSFSEALADKVISDLKEIQSAGPEAVYLAMPCTSKAPRKCCNDFFAKSRVKVLDGVDIIGDSAQIVCSVFKVLYPFDGRVGLIAVAAQDVAKKDLKVNHGVSGILQAWVDKELGFSLSWARDKSQKIYREDQERLIRYWKVAGLGILTAVSSVSLTVWSENHRRANRDLAECEANLTEMILEQGRVLREKQQEIQEWSDSIADCEKSSEAETRRREEEAQKEIQARFEAEKAQALKDARFKNLYDIASFLNDPRWTRAEVEKILSVVSSEDYAVLAEKLKRAHDDTRETRDILRLLVDLSKLEKIAQRGNYGHDTAKQYFPSDELFRRILEDGLREAKEPEVQGLYGQAMAQIISGTRSAVSIEELKSLKVNFSDTSDSMLKQ